MLVCMCERAICVLHGAAAACAVAQMPLELRSVGFVIRGVGKRNNSWVADSVRFSSEMNLEMRVDFQFVAAGHYIRTLSSVAVGADGGQFET